MKSIVDQELIVRGFQYYATSRTLYNRLRIDCQLLSIKILTGITLKILAFNETFHAYRFNHRQRKPKTMCNNAR